MKFSYHTDMANIHFAKRFYLCDCLTKEETQL